MQVRTAASSSSAWLLNRPSQKRPVQPSDAGLGALHRYADTHPKARPCGGCVAVRIDVCGTVQIKSRRRPHGLRRAQRRTGTAKYPAPYRLLGRSDRGFDRLKRRGRLHGRGRGFDRLRCRGRLHDRGRRFDCLR
jgi:hypothetical protein